MDFSNAENGTIGSSEQGVQKQIKGKQGLTHKEVLMKGYNVESGYMGWLNGEYVLFSCEADYREAMEED